MKKTIVLVSGGLDSCCFAAMKKDDDLLLLGFNYGQKGIRELDSIKLVADYLHKPYKVIDLSSVKDIFGQTNQLTGLTPVMPHYEESVVVPLRNALFLQVAMIMGYSSGYDYVALGSHVDDIKVQNQDISYPDCSPEFLQAFEQAMIKGTLKSDKKITIISPALMGLSKSDIITQGLSILGNVMYETWSCYLSGEKHCGICESCVNRKQAFIKAGVPDLTVYQTQQL